MDISYYLKILYIISLSILLYIISLLILIIIMF